MSEREIKQRLDRIEHQLHEVLKHQEKIMSALDDLTTEVSADVASIQAAIAALGTSDTAQLIALTKQLADARASLDAAVKGPTPASS